MTKERYFFGVSATLLFTVVFALMSGEDVFAGDPVSVDVGFCSSAVGAFRPKPSFCETREWCWRTLGDVTGREFNPRTVNVGSEKCQNNCSSYQGDPDSYTEETKIEIGYKAEDLWENSNNYQIAVTKGALSGGYTRITSIGGSTGTSVSKTKTFTKTFTVSAPAGKRICKQYRVDLIDFAYQCAYAYEYERIDRVTAVGCRCSVDTCVRVAPSGNVKATGVREVREYVHIFPETDAVGCGH